MCEHTLFNPLENSQAPRDTEKLNCLCVSSMERLKTAFILTLVEANARLLKDLKNSVITFRWDFQPTYGVLGLYLGNNVLSHTPWTYKNTSFELRVSPYGRQSAECLAFVKYLNTCCATRIPENMNSFNIACYEGSITFAPYDKFSIYGSNNTALEVSGDLGFDIIQQFVEHCYENGLRLPVVLNPMDFPQQFFQN
jgi:hypothetical protein